jgi:uridine monophosphate synthetase
MTSEIINEILNKNIIKYGNFILKNGDLSNIYIDLREIINYPNLRKQISINLANLIKNNFNHSSNNDFGIIGVPIGGIPYSCWVADILEAQLLIVRKELKKHGINKRIEGVIDIKKTYYIIEDVITTGSSVIEILEILKKEIPDIKIGGIITILDRREQSGCDIHGYKMISLLRLNDLLKNDKNKIINIAKNKRSNIIASIDLKDPNRILNLINEIGDYVCGIKLHYDIIKFTDQICEINFIETLNNLKKKRDIFIIEDRKFADIANISILQCEKIAKWADIVTIHCITGNGLIKAFNQNYPNLGLLLIAQMSTNDNLIDQNYTNKVKQFVLDNSNSNSNIVGFIAQERLLNDVPTFTPGVNIDVNNDKLDQLYNSPETLKDRGVSFFIIGRGIYQSDNPIENAKKYRDRCWN